MSFPHFIAKRLSVSSSKHKKLPIVDIATGGIILGTCIMLLSIFIVLGYRQAIYTKILGFNRHIDIVNFDNNSSYQTTPVKATDVKSITKNIKAIMKQEPYAIIGGVASTDEETEAIVLKGVNENYDWTFMREHIVEGVTPNFISEKKSNEILISQTLANRLKLSVGDKLYTHYLQQPPRSRAFKIAGVYNTGVADFDKLFILGDIKHVQKLNKWDENQYSGVSLTLKDFDQQQEITNKLQQKATIALSKNESHLKAVSAKRRFAHIFDWLDIMNMNVKIVLFLIVIVSAFNMISALLVIILEKTRHIGVLKALGTDNNMLRKIFLYKAAYIIGKGLFWGNIIGISLAVLQQKFGFIRLNPETYYLTSVPIKIDLFAWLFLNIGVLVVTTCIMIFPTILITRIAPAKVIRFE
ncbi:lipoprotein-releasing system permease protein [Balneicella halophila]|uniref:Lipoprotein-releasing system permease protein n=1 Tax=Balneicella halophila TaxID=1537566 RepID=A0A7L4UR02_BALHA|nr:FtsX-like permease family protein [Balneicella halophila]PVX52099.1 lipoprotein-releasing system permease protein [Balneicella halophila]